MQSIKKYLRPLYVPIVQWYYAVYAGPQRYKNLFATIKTTKAKRIMEIGTWNGIRAEKMIAVAAKYNLAAEIEYYGFDLFEEMNDQLFNEELSKRPPAESVVADRLKATGVEIHLFKGNTLETLPEVVNNLPKMDFIYIDGGHSYETIANDWKYSEQLMHDDTVVIFDDYWLNREDGGCKLIIDALDRNVYNVWLSKELDVFDNKDFGTLEIRYAFVQKRKVE